MLAADKWIAVRAAMMAAYFVMGGLMFPRISGGSEWLTGATFQKRLAQSETMSKNDAPLREALRQFSQAQRIAVLLDRRVDPGRPLTLSVQDVPVETLLSDIALTLDLGMSMPGPLVYFGPPEAARRLRTLLALRREELRKVPVEVGRKLLQSRSMSWEDLATPRELVTGLAEQAGLEIDGLEQLPHDLWGAADLPSLAWIDRLSLVLVQFDLTFTLDENGRVGIVPVPEEVAVVRNYPGGDDAHETAKSFARIVPEPRVKVVGDRVYVKGLIEEHEKLVSPRRSPSRPTPEKRPTSPASDSFAQKRFTVRVIEQTLGDVLRHIAAQVKLELRIDSAGLERAHVSLDQRVSFNVKDVTIDELLQAATKSARVECRRQGTLVEVGPKKQ